MGLVELVLEMDLAGGDEAVDTGILDAFERLGGAFDVFLYGAGQRGYAYLGKLGADLAINYRAADFAAEIRAKAPGNGADVILDMVGGDYIARNIRSLKADGRLVSIAFLQGAKVEVDFLPVMLKRLTLTGSTLRIRDNPFKGAVADALRQDVWPLLARRSVVPVIDRTLPLDQAAEAHRYMESSRHIGKIVLTTSLNT